MPAITSCASTAQQRGAAAAARACTSDEEAEMASRCTPAAAPNIIAVFISRIATGSVQLGESLST